MNRSPKLQAFETLWRELWTGTTHLDSALAHLPRELKDPVARAISPLLLQPSSLAEALGIGVPPGEPWSLARESLGQWKPAYDMGEAMLAPHLPKGSAPIDRHPSPIEEDFPPHLLQSWTDAFGREVTDFLWKTLATPAPMGVRVGHRSSPQAVVKELNSILPLKLEVSSVSPVGIRIAGYTPVMHTAPFERGDCVIQDEGSQVMALFALWPERVAHLLTEKPSRVPKRIAPIVLPADRPTWTVVDACAGAGGKSLALADALLGKGRVYAYDTAAKKLRALASRATAAGLFNIQSLLLERGNEKSAISAFAGLAQAVLVDAPCSGWGVLRRNPDIKWRQSASELDELPELQLKILETYADLTAPSHRLTYGVCTFRPEETTQVVERFLKLRPDFEKREGGYLGPGPCDGFFMQSFLRRSGGAS